MKKLAIIALAIAPLSIGCAIVDGDQVGSEYSAATQSSGLIDLKTGGSVAGSEAELVRSSSNFMVDVDTVATAGDAYTVWVCGFNYPENCAGPGTFTPSCSLDELLAGAHGAFCQWGAGAVAANDGDLELMNMIDSSYNGQVIIGSGLSEYKDAEIALVVRTHGPALSGQLLTDQLTLVNGGCEPGDPNEGMCDDEQFAAFTAAQ